jgi:glycosyltransferase involved in cell wall biosynthesis
MNVLILRPRIEKGGAGRYIVHLVKSLNKFQPDLRISIATSTGNLLSEIEDLIDYYPIPAYPSSIKNLIDSTIQLRRIIKTNKIDLINTHHRFSSAAANLSRYSIDIPIISTVHEFKDDHKVFSKILFGDETIVFSNAVKRNLLLNYHINPDHIHVIPMGISPKRPSLEETRKIRESYRLMDDTPTIVLIARLSKEKGCSTFLRAASKIISNGIDARFFLVGEGPLLSELRALANQLRIDRNVIFVGWQENIYPFIAIADFLVLPSLNEAFGMTILEGFSLGKTTIGSNVGGIPEIISHNENGILFEPGDSDELASLMLLLIKAPQLSKKLGLNGKKYFLMNHSTKSMVKETIRIFENCIERKNGIDARKFPQQ